MIDRTPSLSLSPLVRRIHRRDELRRYVDLRDALPDGATIASAVARWGVRIRGGRVEDRTELFGSPVVTPNPPEVTAPGGGMRGGAGTVLLEPYPAPSIPPVRYEFRLTVTFSTGETVTWGGVDDLSDWADAGEEVGS